MRRIYRWSTYILLAFIPVFFAGAFMASAFAKGTMGYDIASGLLGAVVCTTPLVGLTALVAGVGNWRERRAGASAKRKNDFIAEFEENPARLQDILRRLSPEDRAYLQQHLAASKLGVSDDGELMSLDELIARDNEEESHNSLFTG